jgi:hypothetical protein
MAGKHRSVRAVHEAGHAVIARKVGLEITRVTAVGKEPAVQSQSAWWLVTREHTANGNAVDVPTMVAALEKDAIVALAGFAAQRRAYPELTPTFDVIFVDDGNDDMLNIRSAIYKIICLTAGKQFPEGNAQVEMDEAMQKNIRAVFVRLENETAARVAEHWPAIKRVAKHLESHDSTDQAEVDRLISFAERLAVR